MKLACELINEGKMRVVSIYMHQSLTYSMLQKDSCKQTLALFFNILFCMQKFSKNKVPFSYAKN